MKKYLLILVVVLMSGQAQSQAPDELRSIFVEAESHYLYGEYELANPLYLMLDDFMPGNANVKYKIGNCYLNIPDEKDKAIEYLEAAVTNVSYDANPESFKELRAPLDAYFSLANAYRINNEFEKALATYGDLNEQMTQNSELINADFVDQQINACKNAIKFIESPISFTAEDMGPEINIGSINSSPAISGDGNSLVFTEQRGLENAIYYLKKEFGKWGEPIEITYQLGDAHDCHSTCLNWDGTELYLYKNDNFDGNIYVSYYEGSSWSRIKKLNKNINTKFYESHASINSDGTKLYFTSNRDGGEGNLDIYVSEKDSKGEWGPAVNLGSAINTPFNEDTPFITANDSVLYFSSEGHINIGGYDIFETRMLGGTWKTPRNLGYPLNTPDDDLFFNPFNNGANAYMSLSSGYKEKNINYITMGDVEKADRVFEIKGILSLNDTIITFNEDYRIILYDLTDKDTVDIGYPNESTGYYAFMVKGNEYRIFYEGLGYFTDSVDVALYDDHPSGFERIDIELQRDENWVAIPDNVEKLDFSQVQVIEAIDSSILVTDVVIRDVSDLDSTNVNVLYYTVQLMALYNPVDVSFFRNTEVTVVYNQDDKFYRYTTGKFQTKEEAYRRRNQLISSLGYPEEIFVKTVFRGNQE